VTGLSVEGSVDGDTMLYFVEEMLAPKLKPEQVIFMDNLAAHKQDEIEDVVEAKGAFVIFLPPYSPDLNPIENCWSKIKTILRSLKPRTFDELLDALTEAFKSVTINDIIGWFTHCGYQAAPT
jgi:transposase